MGLSKMEEATAVTREIIDAHCHIASEEQLPQSFVDGAISNMAASLSARGIEGSERKLAKLYRKKIQDPLCDELVAEMAAAGISRSILLAADFTYALEDCELTVEESFHKHREVLARHPGKFEVFGGVDPRWGQDGIDLFERSLVEFGFRGFKVYPPCGFSPSDPGLFPFYELCAHHQVPVLLHIGPTSPVLAFDVSYPFLLDEAARKFPTVNFIMAHGAVSFTEECAMMCGFRPNVFLDISAFQGSLRKDGMSGAVRRVVSQGINHKIIFGTDWPVFRMQGTQQNFVAAVAAEDGPLSDLTEVEQELILHGNIARLLRPSEAKQLP